MEVAEAGTLLVVRTATGNTWTCRAWFFDPTDNGSVYMTTQPDRSAIDSSTAGIGSGRCSRKTPVRH